MLEKQKGGAIDNSVENVIEFIKDEKRATVTLSQGRFKSKIRKLAESRPEECQIIAENKDGSVCAHIPVSWVKISPPKQISEDTRKIYSERMKNYNGKHTSMRREMT